MTPKSEPILPPPPESATPSRLTFSLPFRRELCELCAMIDHRLNDALRRREHFMNKAHAMGIHSDKIQHLLGINPVKSTRR